MKEIFVVVVKESPRDNSHQEKRAQGWAGVLTINMFACTLVFLRSTAAAVQLIEFVMGMHRGLISTALRQPRFSWRRSHTISQVELYNLF